MAEPLIKIKKNRTKRNNGLDEGLKAVMEEKQVRIGCYLPESKHHAFKKKALARKISITEFLTNSIDEFLARG